MVLCVATWFFGYKRLLGCDKGFPGCDNVVFLLFFYRDNVLFYVVTMSRQRFPCCDRDGHDKRSRLQQSLVKAKRFHVAIEVVLR